mmetsp:Transcript_10947/g.10962  ORF Transcript_10947/g.10962 Transcript_10947/m.10962 type:complete len:344 (-) Transcript_10947:210-1241(-)|eukprot:CAMPEP_0182418548 /NCGR_PEP_ID=MMETSP1167-20130531/2950_1 /TAXON_ID=2988 /ORGANISM="Mallomonas Sp, Strain CCMP3275" /LENGTH=343 /DNA_ID=CAMNT_0024592803 /DNA_START=71 /DNA_END=1102 /DNA_ORIENTATION=-
MFDFDDDEEVESSVIFKQAASDLTSVTNLDSTLSKFGFTKDDRIERRDLVVLFKTVEKDMEKEISSQAHDGEYDGAKEMRLRLTNLRNEFENLQMSAVSLERDDQASLFEKASAAMRSKLDEEQIVMDSEMTAVSDNMINDLNIKHSIQIENLEKEIDRLPRPPIKYSRRLIEMFKAEAGLIKLCEYEEARKVRTVIDRIRPKEEKRFWAAFEAKIELKRANLRETQEGERGRLLEKLKGIMLKERRKKTLDADLLSQRLINHSCDMSHAHNLQKRLKPEMSVKPSALWQNREGYKNTSAALRGQLLLDRVHGKRPGASVHAESLVNRHDFDKSLQDTMKYTT